MWDNLFSSVDLLKKGLDVTWLRNQVIANNIANVDTPGFKSSEVEFEDFMTAALKSDDESKLELRKTHSRHIDGSSINVKDILDIEPKVVRKDSTSVRLDDNNVDIETEMVALAKNQIEYYALVNRINSEFEKLNTAINIK
ncbi:MAG: flagellar basal body rod protein FlgB [Eubacteriales bacterium]|jgi:flagellar basal-body rod protein FlgB